MSAIEQLLAVMRVSQYQAYYNAQVKQYPDGSASVLVLDRAVIRERGLEAVGQPERAKDDGPQGPEDKGLRNEAASLARSRRRARAAVTDLARATPFKWFVTLTVDPEKLNRYDAEECFRHLHDWLDNNVRRHGLTYVLIPEYHKDGAIHFHALFNDVMKAVDSGTISLPGGGKPRRARSKAQRAAWLAAGGNVVYNLPGWGWGFSTAIELYGDINQAVGYVVKYITKSERKIGGRWYYSGGDLRRPSVSTLDADFDAAASMGAVFEIEELGAHGVKLNLKGDHVNETLERLARPAGAVFDPAQYMD